MGSSARKKFEEFETKMVLKSSEHMASNQYFFIVAFISPFHSKLVP
jgi:hypothetical protein